MAAFKINSKTHGGFIVQVDDEDLERVKNQKWCIRIDQDNTPYAYGTAKKPRVEWGNGVKQRQIPMTWFILNYSHTSDKIDHINHNTLDNRKSNLRIATPLQSSRNRRKFKNARSKYKGVSWDGYSYNRSSNKPWKCSIRIDKKLKNAGRFKTEEEAALRYNELALKHFGEFAKLNEIKPPRPEIKIAYSFGHYKTA